MKKFLAALLIGLSLVTFTLDASAARLGGGASFGRSMSVPKSLSVFSKGSSFHRKTSVSCPCSRCSRSG